MADLHAFHRPAPQAKRGAGRFLVACQHIRATRLAPTSAERWGNLMCASASYRFIASPRSIPRLDWDFPPIHVAPHSTGFPQRGHTPSPDIALQQMRETIAAKRNEGRCREGGSSTAREGRARSKRPERRGDGEQTDRDRVPAEGALNREKVPRLAARAVNVAGCIPETLREGGFRVRRFLSPTGGRRSLPLALRCGAAPAPSALRTVRAT